MAIPHASSGQVVDILSGDGSLPSAQSYAVFKSGQLEVMRLVLPAGKAFPPHRVAGEITVQCLSGRLELNVDGTRQELRTGQLMFLAGGVQHGLLGLEDAVALVTIVLCKA
ncbi:MAG TPA: cupin domain-containing protein [Burkholderiaceae bacterium]